MAVGAGSIKRASKLNAEAETKKNVVAEAETVTETAPIQAEAEKKAPAKKTTTTKTAAKKTATRKAPAKKAEEKPVAEKPVEEKPVVETSVVTNIDPAVLDVVLTKKQKKNQACHLTEDMPIHLL